MTDATELDLDAVRARLDAATERWTWHEDTDDTLAGWGAHMGQMLYRLPSDGQTDDMRDSILAMVADLEWLLAELDEARKQARDGTEFYATANAESMRRALAAEARAEAAESSLAAVRAREESDERWNTAVDWVLNHGATYDLIGPFWAYCDGLITEKELRSESVTAETINRRRERAEARAALASTTERGGQ